MTCAHCVLSVREEVSEISGVESVDVDLASGRLRVAGADVRDDAVLAAVAEAGYEARLARPPRPSSPPSPRRSPSCSAAARWPAARSTPTATTGRADGRRTATPTGPPRATAGASRPRIRSAALAVAENGLRLVVDDARAAPRPHRDAALPRRRRATATTVRDFDVEHTKRMHLIVARRDLTGFQHLHPRAGRRRLLDDRRCALDDAGLLPPVRRLLATTASATTLGRRPARRRRAPTCARCRRRAPPRSATAATTCALDAGGAHPGEEAELRFTITKDGRPVDTEPYLGAGGHLVALREGDLAFLHVHPTTRTARRGRDRASRRRSRPPGRYRLFLQFKHDGRVQTVAFTQEVE